MKEGMNLKKLIEMVVEECITEFPNMSKSRRVIKEEENPEMNAPVENHEYNEEREIVLLKEIGVRLVELLRMHRETEPSEQPTEAPSSEEGV